jgi:hypothetical protein
MAYSSDVSKWTSHFKHMARSGKVKQKKFYTIQRGSGDKIIDPRIVSISPTQQAERIAISQIENDREQYDNNYKRVYKRKPHTGARHTSEKRSKQQTQTIKPKKKLSPTPKASKKRKKANTFKLSRN